MFQNSHEMLFLSAVYLVIECIFSSCDNFLLIAGAAFDSLSAEFHHRVRIGKHWIVFNRVTAEFEFVFVQ